MRGARMCRQTERSLEHFVALATSVRFRCVGLGRLLLLLHHARRRQTAGMQFALVHQHVAVAAERAAAHVAVVVLDARVRGHVACQIAGRHERLLAHRAQLVAHATVDLLVRLKVAQRGELFATDLALERPFAGVRAHVNGQIVLLGEASRAERAAERPVAGVRADVQLQLGGTLERLVAFVAGGRDAWLWLGASLLALLGSLSHVTRFPLGRAGRFGGVLRRVVGIVIVVVGVCVVCDIIVGLQALVFGVRGRGVTVGDVWLIGVGLVVSGAVIDIFGMLERASSIVCVRNSYPKLFSSMPR